VAVLRDESGVAHARWPLQQRLYGPLPCTLRCSRVGWPMASEHLLQDASQHSLLACALHALPLWRRQLVCPLPRPA